jgi:nucleoside-diphosphate-sugar epimerase
MKALVTGASGFIGSHLADALVNKGYAVTCLLRKNSNPKWIEHLDIDYIICDLFDTESFKDKVSAFDLVFHLAGLTKAISEKEFFQANVDATSKLLHVLANTNSTVRRFVFLSSHAATGPSSNGTPVDENSPAMPVSSYGRSKLEGEREVLRYKGSIPFTILRAPAVYGPRDTDFLLLFKTIKKGFYPYWGKSYYSLLYVEDLIQGIILSAERQEAEDKTFFLSDNVFYTNDDIAREISLALSRKAIKLRLPRTFMPFLALASQKINKRSIINKDRIKDFRFANWTCDGGKARNEIGFTPKINLRKGMQWTADWYKIHRWL